MSVLYLYRRGSSTYQSEMSTLEQALDAAYFDLNATKEPWKSTEPIKIVDGKQEYDKAYILEQVILKATEETADNLDSLLREAIEQMDEEWSNRLLEKVHQLQAEIARDLRGWSDSEPDEESEGSDGRLHQCPYCYDLDE